MKNLSLAGPLRVLVFAETVRSASKSRKAKTIGCAWCAWSPDQCASFGEGRLSGSGTFLFAGFIRARQTALRAFANEDVRQVSVRTNQDRTVFVWNRRPDGQVVGYDARD
jgi:hypothetical protein